MEKLFDSGDYGAHHSVTEPYEENEAKLRAAIASGEPFDTGWYGAKKEIEYARISRAGYGYPIEVEARCQMDDGPELTDTAFWKAFGGGDTCSCGHDGLMKLGLTEDEASAKIEAIAEEMELGEDVEEERKATVDSDSTYETVMEKLEALIEDADGDLSSIFNSLILRCETEVEELRSKQ